MSAKPYSSSELLPTPCFPFAGELIGEPVRARVRRAGSWQDLPFDELKVGDVVSHLEFAESPAVMYRVEFEGGRL